MRAPVAAHVLDEARHPQANLATKDQLALHVRQRQQLGGGDDDGEDIKACRL
jgi:hypothetical protein